VSVGNCQQEQGSLIFEQDKPSRMGRLVVSGGIIMYIWIGCKLPVAFEKEIRQRCLLLNKAIGLDTAAFSLPQHISLKISFEADRPEEILTFLEHYLSSQQPFTVTLHAPEQMGNILWIPVEENIKLQQLHALLDNQLQERFGIPQHEFDKCFQFHSTLFIDSDVDKLTTMTQALAGCVKTQEMKIDRFLLGLSETGKAGSYRVVREIKI
jgi:2'-5' RNA ligase